MRVVVERLIGVVLVAALGCASKFEGPYPCITGYASCSTDNGCETNLDNDADHCGECGTRCGLGGRCNNGTCGDVAEEIANLSPGTHTSIAVNSWGVFWGDQGNIVMAPLTGGSPTTVATNVFTCNGIPFAVDDDNLYYRSDGLMKVSATGTTTTLIPNQANQSTNGCGLFIGLDAENVYASMAVSSGGSQDTYTLSTVPIVGGTVVTLGTWQSNNNGGYSPFVVAGDVVVLRENNPNGGSSSFRLVPIDGGEPRLIATDNLNLYGFSGFTADANNAYVVGSGCGSCNNDSPNYSGPPFGGVGMLPLDGNGPGSVFARFTGQALSVAVDRDHVYWTTDTALWKAPIAGGDVVQLAGGLGAGVPAYRCDGSCTSGPSSGTTMSIAVDATSVYIAASAAGVILKVAK